MIDRIATLLFMGENNFPEDFPVEDAEAIMFTFGLSEEYLRKAESMNKCLNVSFEQGFSEGVKLVRETVGLLRLSTNDEDINKGIQVALATVAVAIAACDDEFKDGDEIADSHIGDAFTAAVKDVTLV